MRATLFVPTDYIGGGPMSWPGIEQWVGTEHEPELVPMSWDDARELQDAGWEVASHTCSHPRLPEVSDKQLVTELRESRRICEQELGGPVARLPIPMGTTTRGW